jgi:hypothetical protein
MPNPSKTTLTKILAQMKTAREEEVNWAANITANKG